MHEEEAAAVGTHDRGSLGIVVGERKVLFSFRLMIGAQTPQCSASSQRISAKVINAVYHEWDRVQVFAAPVTETDLVTVEPPEVSVR